MAPSTPKAGSNLVSSTGPEDCVGVAVALAAVALAVGVAVLLGCARVSRMVVGTKEVTWSVLPADTVVRMTGVDVTMDVTLSVIEACVAFAVREAADADADADAWDDDGGCWAPTRAMRRKERRDRRMNIPLKKVGGRRNRDSHG